MVLTDTNIMDWQFDEMPAFRLCAMSSTVFTPKFFALLDRVRQPDFPHHLAECAAETRRRCRRYVHQIFSSPAIKEPADPQTLRLAAKLYAIFDDILLAAPMEEKIGLWKASYLAAEQQLLQTASFKVDISDIPAIPPESSSGTSFRQLCCGMAGELLDYSDELEAWLDLHFVNEFDSYSEASPFDEVVQVISDLRSMAKEIETASLS